MFFDLIKSVTTTAGSVAVVVTVTVYTNCATCCDPQRQKRIDSSIYNVLFSVID